MVRKNPAPLLQLPMRLRRETTLHRQTPRGIDISGPDSAASGAATAIIDEAPTEDDTSTTDAEPDEVSGAGPEVSGADIANGDDAAPDGGSPPTDAEQLEDAQQRFLGYFEDGLYPQALVAANQAVKLSRKVYGKDSLETALALTNRATVQNRTGDYQNALKNYQRSIRIIEDREGIVSPRLVNPLMGLAATHNTLGAFDRGLRHYQRALRINHVELGLNNLEQMTIRDGLTASYIGVGKADDADFQQEVQLRIVQTKYGNDLEYVLPAAEKLAEWYGNSNQYEKQMLLQQGTLQAIRKAGRKEQPGNDRYIAQHGPHIPAAGDADGSHPDTEQGLQRQRRRRPRATRCLRPRYASTAVISTIRSATCGMRNEPTARHGTY